MGKKKKKTVPVKINTKPKPRDTNDILCDTRADIEPILDLNVQGQTIEGLLNLKQTYDTRDNITVSFRVPKNVLDWAKTTAMKESLAHDEEIHYQKLILSCFLDRYPLVEKE
jgi:hypothetical protein